jgi:hypothetical protein
MLGDNAYDSGTDAEYQAAVFDMYPALLRKSVLWPTRGNHDVLYGGANNDYYDIFSMPAQGEAGGVPSGSEAYYSFDYANVHFVCLDSEGSNRSPDGAMLTWLSADLAATTQDWIVAYWHHPPYTKGSHDSDNPFDSGGRMEEMRENALPILEAGGVDLVLCGHSHSYERSFLIDEHYGSSDTFTDSMRVDGGDGRPEGDGAYVKPGPGAAPHAGAVYAVAGSSSRTSGGSLDHPVMIVSYNLLGSMVLDFEGNRLDAVFLGDDRTVLDEFTMIKEGGVGERQPVGVPGPDTAAARLSLGAIEPTPTSSSARIVYTLPREGSVAITVHDSGGRLVAAVASERRSAGRHAAVWDGRTASGARAGAGVYFARVGFEGSVVARKLIVVR